MIKPPGKADLDRLSPLQRDLASEADREAKSRISYVDGYFAGGDPPPNIGVCTDVIIRAFMSAKIDIRELMHKDVVNNPVAYGIKHPDPNIDHRRVRFLIVFFSRNAMSLPLTGELADWQPGDIVFWSTREDGKTDHVGMVGCHRGPSGKLQVVHHWPGMNVMEEDALERFQIVGHFRWPAS